jgi:c-di-AMP phosphodiesterase-like protein
MSEKKNDWSVMKVLKPTNEESAEYITKGYIKQHLSKLDKYTNEPLQMISIELVECDEDGKPVWVNLFVNDANLGAIVSAQADRIAELERQLAEKE